MLINFPVSGVGYSFQYRNLGETENKGWEVTLNWNAINKKNYALSFNANVGFNKNKVKSLGSLMDYSADSVGHQQIFNQTSKYNQDILSEKFTVL